MPSILGPSRPRFWSRFTIGDLIWHISLWSGVLALDMALNNRGSTYFLLGRFAILVVVMELLTHFFPTPQRLFIALVAVHVLFLIPAAITGFDFLAILSPLMLFYWEPRDMARVLREFSQGVLLPGSPMKPVLNFLASCLPLLWVAGLLFGLTWRHRTVRSETNERIRNHASGN